MGRKVGNLGFSYANLTWVTILHWLASEWWVTSLHWLAIHVWVTIEHWLANFNFGLHVSGLKLWK